MSKKQPADIFKENLDELMTFTGISYADVGRASGSDPSTIRLIRIGERKPTINKAEDIARAFGLNGWQMLQPNILKIMTKSKQMNLLLESYINSPEEGQDYILRIAEKESSYSK